MPVDLSAGRHHRVPVSPSVWNCPACDGVNTGPLGEGCVHCGAGKPRTPPPPGPVGPAEGSGVPTFLRKAFESWYATSLTEPDLHGLLMAFVAGHQFAVDMLSSAQTPPLPQTFTPAGKPARTLAAALSLFMDQILSSTPEEIGTGEWCSMAEAQSLLERLRKEGQS